MAEKERFELSRRLIPTYTLSRGASSANLSTSPYTLRIAVIQIRLTIITHFRRFVNIFLKITYFILLLCVSLLVFKRRFTKFLFEQRDKVRAIRKARAHARLGNAFPVCKKLRRV